MSAAEPAKVRPASEVGPELKERIARVNKADVSPKQKLEQLNKIVHLSHSFEKDSWTKYVDVATMYKSLRRMLVHPQRSLRTAGLRCLRYYLPTRAALRELLSLGLHLFVARSLERVKDQQRERMEAIRLVRRIMDVDINMIPRALVCTLIAIAEVVPEEPPFRQLALEILCEIAIMNTELVALCNGVKTIFAAILDVNNGAYVDTLTITMIYLMNDLDTRQFIRDHVDALALLSPLNDVFPKGEDKNGRRASSRVVIAAMLKSWTGLITLSSEGNNLLRSLVNALRWPSRDVQRLVLAVVFEVFQFQPGGDTMDGHTRALLEGHRLLPRVKSTRHNILSNFQAAVLLSFVNAGLIDVLVELGATMDRGVAKQATELIGELMSRANLLLPMTICAKLQQMPMLIQYATAFDGPEQWTRMRASRMVSDLCDIASTKVEPLTFGDFHLSLIVTGANKWRRRRGVDRKRDRVEKLKANIDANMNQATFDYMLKDSKVLVSKDYQRWNWGVIDELLQGPLLQPQRLDATIKGPKTKEFIIRLIRFYRPSKKDFVTLSAAPGNVRYVRTGCYLLEVLMSTEVSRESPATIELIREISSALQIETEQAPEHDPGRVFSKTMVAKTLAAEYFTLLGTLSSTMPGLELMQKHKIFTHLFNVCNSRDDLAELILQSLDYNIDGLSRNLLATTINKSESRRVRSRATQHMRTLLRAGVSDFEGWGIDLLVQRLADPEQVVADDALGVLLEACDEPTNLAALVKAKPKVTSKAGEQLLMRFLQTEKGAQYLRQIGFIKKHLQYWLETGWTEYVSAVENAITTALAMKPDDYPIPGDPEAAFDIEISAGTVPLPRHFFGELTRTKIGCEVMSDHGKVVDGWIAAIDRDDGKPLERRAALWAVGSIGSHSLGFEFIRGSKVIPRIVAIAESVQSCSLRGTCFFVLGLLSRTKHGRKALERCGWYTPADHEAGIAVPLAPEQFFSFGSYQHTGSWPVRAPVLEPQRREIKEYRGKHTDVLTRVYGLANNVQMNEAFYALVALKNEKPDAFQDPELMLAIYHHIDAYLYRLFLRRILFNMFDYTAVSSGAWDKVSLTVPKLTAAAKAPRREMPRPASRVNTPRRSSAASSTAGSAGSDARVSAGDRARSSNGAQPARRNTSEGKDGKDGKGKDDQGMRRSTSSRSGRRTFGFSKKKE